MSAWLAMALSAAALHVVDDRGRSFVFPEPARRMVALAPHLAEIAFAAGAGGALAGVSSASEHPEEARRLPVLASHGRADAERIALARPDLVLAWLSGTPAREIDRLERMGLPVFVTEIRSLDDIPRVVRTLGRLAGTAAAADAEARAIEAGIAALPRRAAALPVFVEIWHRPLMTVNGAHLISDVLRRCGARNVFEAAPALSFAVSREQLLVARPGAVVAGDAEAARRWPAIPIHVIDPRLMHSQGPRLVGVARDLCARLAP